MNYYAWTEPTARKRHRCETCYRAILPGEQYRRCAGLGDGEAWTYKTCEHCYRVSAVWASQQGEYDWDNDCILEWLEESHPAKYSSPLARWRYPDGEIMPLPFVRHCYSCGVRIDFEAIWCAPCDTLRCERITGQLIEISRGLGADS